MKNGFQNIDCDFLLIGSGLAGLYAANYAAQFGKVVVITKSDLKISSSYLAQGGIAASIDPDDSTEYHYDDTLKAGKEICDNEAVTVLVNEGKKLIEEIVSLGFPFDKENGEIALGMEAGHCRRRILHAGGDATGSKIVNFYVNLVKNKNQIKIYENTIAYELLSNKKVCSGALAYNWKDNESIVFNSKSTILAAGGASGIFSRTTNPHTSTGDGIGLAYEAGAVLSDMEFVQFHPTAFYSPGGKTFLISEAVRGEGAHLVNHDEDRFLIKQFENAELVTRDILSRSICNELKRTGKKNVFLKLTHLDADKIKRRFSNICAESLKFNVDITKDLVPVTPAAHYMIGGVKTDINGCTNIKNLFACGEVASTGVHGANRLASNSLLECIVFGKRAVDSAVKLYSESRFEYENFETKKYKINDELEEEYCEIKNELAELMTQYVGIERNEESILYALAAIDKISNRFSIDNYEYYSSRLKSIIEVCRLICKSALKRKESRGVHYRSDYPDNNDKMLGHLLHRINKETEFQSLGNS